MAEHSKPGPPEDSLDRVERLMAIEEAFSDEIQALAPIEREWLLREIEARIERGEFGDGSDFDDDELAVLVRRLGPRSPRGHAGAAVKPEELFFE